MLPGRPRGTARVTGNAAQAQAVGERIVAPDRRGRPRRRPGACRRSAPSRRGSTVSGQASKILPFLPIPRVSETVQGPVERFVEDDGADEVAVGRERARLDGGRDRRPHPGAVHVHPLRRRRWSLRSARADADSTARDAARAASQAHTRGEAEDAVRDAIAQGLRATRDCQPTGLVRRLPVRGHGDRAAELHGALQGPRPARHPRLASPSTPRGTPRSTPTGAPDEARTRATSRAPRPSS